MAEPKDTRKTLEAVREVLSRGHPYTTYEVAGYLQIVLGRMISESAVSARIRDLRKPQFGGYTVNSRPRRGCSAWEYQIDPHNSAGA